MELNCTQCPISVKNGAGLRLRPRSLRGEGFGSLGGMDTVIKSRRARVRMMAVGWLVGTGFSIAIYFVSFRFFLLLLLLLLLLSPENLGLLALSFILYLQYTPSLLIHPSPQRNPPLQNYYYYYSMAAANSPQKQCYFPDGTPTNFKKDTIAPCDPDPTSSHSACCPADSVCLSNGLCFQQVAWGNRVSRSACTDEEWESERCAGVCTDVWTRDPISLYLVQPDSERGNFCCGGMYNGTSCPARSKGSYEPFELEKGLALFPNTSLTLEEYAMEVQRNSSARVDNEEEEEEAVVGGGNGNGATTTPSSTPTDPANTTNPSTSSPPTLEATTTSNNNTPPIIALGISLGMLLLITTALLFFQWRKANSLQKQLEQVKLSTTTTPLVSETSYFPPPPSQSHDGGGVAGWSAITQQQQQLQHSPGWNGNGSGNGNGMSEGWSSLPSSDLRSEMGSERGLIGGLGELSDERRRGELQG
ncbi:uncharacterized protein RCC_09285 [Ramularia collo-cygni]|uniref:Uncharacterized protein n=1 Tax=Ramularia collo-cygni TaxID=112498 RepID=A0A2D3VHA3_9PEZI|nr:uncharacterized protein RCC_09285 [Ramularia collo-cygni]CZT23571.1 uncharacterized protein RCC_09285 [Ramularia collo-cygni]